jgi:hypothetical protein
VNQYQDESGVWHIDVAQPGTSESRIVDGNGREREDRIFGRIQETNRWFQVDDLNRDDLDEAYLKQGWVDEELMEARSSSEKHGWSQRTIWGFHNVIDGEFEQRKHVRKLVIKKGTEVVRGTFVYDHHAP